MPSTVQLDTGTRTAATFSGQYANSIWLAAVSGAGFVYDAGIDRFVIFIDDGFLYTISYVSDSNWQVDRMTLSGTAPTAGHSNATAGGGGQVGVWGRMQYVPNLHGICIIQAYDKPAYFVRTT